MIHDLFGFVLSNHWAISEDGRRAVLAHLIQARNGGLDASMIDKIVEGVKERNLTNYASAQIGTLQSSDFSWSSKLDNLTGDVIAIARFEGIMTRSGSWWSKGTEDLRNELKILGQNSRVKAVILRLNTVGGTVDGTEEAAIEIRDFEKTYQKPLVVFVDGCACSGGMWIATQAKRLYASSNTCLTGSIGTIGSFYDDREMLKEMGITEVTVRATKSPNKNTMYDAAADGDDTEWRTMLDSFNAVFHNYVKKGRGNKLKTTPSVKIGEMEVPEVLTGKIYVGQESVEIGLIDKIDTIDNLVLELQTEISNAATNKPVVTNQNRIMFKKGLGALVAALFSNGATPTEEEIEKTVTANAELEGVTSDQIAKLVAAEVAVLTENLAKTTANVTTFSEKIESVKTRLTTVEVESKAVKSENTQLKTAIADIVAGRKGVNVGGDDSHDTENHVEKPLTKFNGILTNKKD